MRLPSLFQWKQLPKVLSKKEKQVLLIFVFLFFGSLIFLGINTIHNLPTQPAFGGTHIEGVIGRPQFINPIFAPFNPVDKDLVKLIFSGLMKHTPEGKIVPDLAAKYEVNEKGTLYKITLRDNLFWNDGTPLTAKDVVFTIETIQNPDFNSPLRIKWLGITVTKISNQEIHFQLRNPYHRFIENLTLKILPKHIWQDIPANKWRLNIQNNLHQPIGSGPYQVQEIRQDRLGYIKFLNLKRNTHYHNQKPFITQITFRFFENEEALIKAAKRKEITGFSLADIPNNHSLQILQNNFELHKIIIPRFFAVFFNHNELELLADRRIRQALNYGTNKEEIIKTVFDSKAFTVDSPILPEIFGFEKPKQVFQFNIEKANKLLDQTEFKKQDGQRNKTIITGQDRPFRADLRQGMRGAEVRRLQQCLARFPAIYPEGKITGYFGPATRRAVIRFQEKYADEILAPWGFTRGTGLVAKTTRKKLNKICGQVETEEKALTFTLTTVDQPELVAVANLLKEQWQALGIKIEVEAKKIDVLKQDFIIPRNYEALLFGKSLGLLPDLFPFWHSSQIKEPGLNLARYESVKADELLEEIRQNLNPKKRIKKIIELQNIIIADAPAVFLYSPYYLYWTSKEIKEVNIQKIVEPSKRFKNIENWYIETKRIWR